MMTDDELELAELYKDLVYENEALKAELTEAQSYKADAERYIWIGEHWEKFIELINSLSVYKIQEAIDKDILRIKNSNQVTEKTPTEAIDQAMRESN